jgi:CO dehydrogenase maturation factor
MKVIISGKGGSGKSTISVLTARALSDRGYKVLLVDGDESNVGLHRLMGISQPVVFMDNFGGKKGFKQRLNQSFPKGNADEMLGRSMKFDDLPDECVADVDGIKMIAIGKIHNEGEGCACPVGMLSKMVLSRLVIEDDEIVIIDAEAGVEHFGRGVVAGCDMVICVVDPSFESFMLAKKITDMAESAGKELCFVLNKVDDKVVDAMGKNIDKGKVIAKIPNSNEIFMDSLEGRKISTDITEIGEICQKIEESKKNLSSE